MPKKFNYNLIVQKRGKKCKFSIPYCVVRMFETLSISCCFVRMFEALSVPYCVVRMLKRLSIPYWVVRIIETLSIPHCVVWMFETLSIPYCVVRMFETLSISYCVVRMFETFSNIFEMVPDSKSLELKKFLLGYIFCSMMILLEKDDYTSVGSTNFRLLFCATWWVEDQRVAGKLLSIWNDIVLSVRH